MFTELVDRLRCPRPHADSWLVAATDVVERRRIVRGTLGCPVCAAEYPIEGGVARFDDGHAATRPVPLHPLATHGGEAATGEDAIDRLAAQLNLVEAPEPVLLAGTWGALAAALVAQYPHVVAVVADSPVALPLDERLSPLTTPAIRFPLADRSVRAVALDAAHASPAWIAEAARVSGAGARLVVPVAGTYPEAPWRRVASDASVHVMERDAPASAPVQLTRAPGNWLFGR